MRQWHPLFAYFLRQVLEGRYEVLTNLAVGDVPREADVVVLKRSALRGPQFRHLWKWLTHWNILEFKGPTVRPRESHLDLLLELGLGVARRLNEQRVRDKLRPLAPRQISWWYVVRELPRSMRTKWEQRVGRLSQLENGLWRGVVVGYPLYLLSSIETSLDDESLPLHLLGARRPQEEAALAQYVLRHADVFCHYAPWMFALHTRAWKKEQAVIGKVIDDNLEIDWTPVVEEFGLDLLIRQVGLARVVEEVGLARVVEEVGLARVIEEVGVDKLLDSLTPDQLARLKARL
ncbi:MAG: hypothetical protein GX575_28200 [Candidatus Anammoximicrobium sp.]|nr:hypothetical protein [Candidatus Anammoximicrobium sp.]